MEIRNTLSFHKQKTLGKLQWYKKQCVLINKNVKVRGRTWKKTKKV